MAIPDWHPNELAHAGEEHLDPEFIAAYDQKQATDPTEDVAALRELGLDESSTLVDLGAGTGTFSLAVAPHCRRVVAVDVSPQMVEFLNQRAAQAGIQNVEAVQGGFLTYQHQGEQADFVYSRNALHHLPDFWKALALERVHAMLKPGGVFFMHDLIYSFEASEAAQIIEGWLGNAPDDPEAGYTRDDLATHIREEYSTFSWLLEPMLERAGFEIRNVTHRPTRTFSAYTCIKSGS